MKSDVLVKPLLSICVPTYNRLKYLRELLDEVLAQVRELAAAEVEVCVSDNVSTDGTADYLSGLSSSLLRWWTNAENIGGDRNFLKCIREARGTYVWLIGDDELLPPEAIRRVLEALADQKPGLLISVDDETDRAARCYAGYRETALDNPEGFVLAHTLISANVFKRSIFDLAFAESKLAFSYAHMFGLMKNLPGERVAVLSRFIAVRPVRADFAKYPSFLCVKQGLYVLYLVRQFALPPRYRRYAVRMMLNLPLEFASRIKSVLGLR